MEMPGEGWVGQNEVMLSVSLIGAVALPALSGADRPPPGRRPEGRCARAAEPRRPATRAEGAAGLPARGAGNGCAGLLPLQLLYTLLALQVSAGGFVCRGLSAQCPVWRRGLVPAGGQQDGCSYQTSSYKRFIDKR